MVKPKTIVELLKWGAICMWQRGSGGPFAAPVLVIPPAVPVVPQKGQPVRGEGKLNW